VISLPTARRAQFSLVVVLFAAVSLFAQTSTPTSQHAIPMREESHHHLIFQNSYVNVFFVEIPPHESTLPHHHDLPYISVPPGGPDAPPYDDAPVKRGPEVGYSAGNFSHVVTNSSEVTLRNLAVELVRPQGTFRNGCVNIMRDQPPGTCDEPGVAGDQAHYPAPDFESDEIVVESWFFDRGRTPAPLDDPHDMLIAGLNGVSVSGASGLGSADALPGGVLWVPAGSKPVFKTSPQHDGHFIAIVFKDSGAAP
jgi:hypothetical protein